MELAKITSKGQLTLPVSRRRKFGIETGDQLLFYECDGRIILAPVTPATLADAQEAAARQHIYTLDEIRKITVPIAERYRLKKLSLFGSYARGEASASSDIDFSAEFPEAFGLFRLGNLQNDLEDALRKKVDIVTEGMLKDSLSDGFAQNIREDEVLLYGDGR